MVGISYIIPHKGRDHMLLWHLRELNRQTFRDFEVIVVVDEDVSDLGTLNWEEYSFPITLHFMDKNRGPATARNAGVKKASADIVMFVGDDCIPSRGLIGRHWLAHKQFSEKIVQGYTPWHPDSTTPFMSFLDASGLQANWGVLKQEDGKWLRTIPAGFCLTTNYSIEKRLFKSIGGFNETFSGAAWEDIEMGYRLNKFGLNSTFVPEAVNYHYHRYELPGFLQRCYMEGTHRMTICGIHPEMSWSLLEPDYLRVAEKENEDAVLNFALNILSPNKEEMYKAWAEACRVFSFKGIASSIETGFPGLKALYYAEHPNETVEILAGVTSIKSGRWSYALHCGEWMLTQRPGHWYTHAFLAEVKRAVGDYDGALFSVRNALTLNPAAEWPRELARELSRR